jgi:hypothetical protein
MAVEGPVADEAGCDVGVGLMGKRGACGDECVEEEEERPPIKGAGR